MNPIRFEYWLERTAWDLDYWLKVEELSAQLNSDGCTGVSQMFQWLCWEHDIHYRTHEYVTGGAITKQDADYIFRRRIQQTRALWFKWIVSWVRWFGVAVLFRRTTQAAWDSYGKSTDEALRKARE